MVKLQAAGKADPNAAIKGVLFGHSGAGKSYTGATAPKPAILLTERNGLQSIRASNPDAAYSYCSTIGEVRDFVMSAHNGELQKAGYETLVIDSLTEVQRLIMDDIALTLATNAKWGFDEWREMTERMRRFMRMIRDLDMHVLAICLADRRTDEGGGNIHVAPSFQGKKIADEVAQYFNFVGYQFKRAGTDGEGNPTTDYRVMFNGPDRYVCKSCHPLTGICEPNVSAWFDTIVEANRDGGTGAPTEPAKPTPAPRRRTRRSTNGA